MEYLDGLIAMDLDDGYEKHKCEIPGQYKDVFFKEVVGIQLCGLLQE